MACRTLFAVALVLAAVPALAQSMAGRTGFDSGAHATPRPGWRMAILPPPPTPGALAYLEEQRVGHVNQAPQVGIEFRSADRPTTGLLRGSLVRMPLQGGGTLSLRLRGGGLGVVMKKEF